MKLRVLIADDSAFMRGAIARLLGADDRFEVVGQARDGAEAVRMAAELSPDVMTMDFNMPGYNGAEATRRILAASREEGKRAVGIVMLSAHTSSGARETMEALSAGAVDFVTKPGGEVMAHLGDIKSDLVQKLLAAAKANVAPVEIGATTPSRRPPRTLPPLPAGLRLVVLAASTGGPAALERVVAELPKRDGVAYVIVQHMPTGYTSALAERLDQLSPCAVREATTGDRVSGGVILVAPGGSHLEIDKSGIVRMNDGPLVHGVRPAADVTLKSAALAFGARAIGVVMTGMGRDGAAGLAAVKSAGGLTLAQDAATSTVFGMPKAALDLGVVDQMLALSDIAPAIERVTR